MCACASSKVRGPPSSLGPRQRAEALLALAHRVAGVRGVALDAHPQVAEQPQRGRRRRWRRARARARSSIGVQRAGRAPVVEARRADQLDRHLALDALDRAHQQVVGVVVGRRARVRARAAAAVPVADRQRVAHDQPAGRRHPGRLEHVGARARSGGRPARRRRRGRGGTSRRCGRAARRTRSAPSKRGRHSHSTEPSGATSAPVWQSERKRVVGDRRERRAVAPRRRAAPGRRSRGPGRRGRRAAVRGGCGGRSLRRACAASRARLSRRRGSAGTSRPAGR